MIYSPHEHAILQEFGRRVRNAREARDWSQEDLAEKAQLDRTYVGAVERGERNLSLLSINKLARALNESFDGFLPWRPTRRQQPRIL